MNTFPEKITSFAWAICGFEGFENGAASYNNKNQGNLRYDEYTVKLGATSVSPAGFARFPTYEKGFLALQQFLFDAASGSNEMYLPTMTFAEFFGKYSPSSDHNNPDEYAAIVCLHIGFKTTDTLSSLLT